MYAFIVCPSCGFAIGAIDDEFQAMRQELIEEWYKGRGFKVLPEMMPMVNCDINLDAVYKKLGVRNICCKTHLMCAIKYVDYY